MSKAGGQAGTLDALYDLVTGDEDARVCKDIPDSACDDQPRNFFAYLTANLLNKISDEIASAKLVLPWILSALGAPAAFAGFLVPIREAGALLPQLAVAAYIRARPIRKGTWIAGALLCGLALAMMALAAGALQGVAAGWAFVFLLALFSLARGLCSVSAKDVLGKTVSKSRRGVLMGYAAGIAGAATLVVGVYVQWFTGAGAGTAVFVGLLGFAAALWGVAAAVFAAIREQPGAVEGGGNALAEALRSLDMLRSDLPLRRFVIARVLLLGVALAPPFYVILGQQSAGAGLEGLGLLIIANGVAASVSAPLWGRMGDRSSRMVMVLAAGVAAALGIATWAMAAAGAAPMASPVTFAVLYFLLTVAHGGVRLGRKVYLVDMASAQTRAAYVALSNTVIGVAMLGGGAFGILADILDPAQVILALGLLSLIAAGYAWTLREVSG